MKIAHISDLHLDVNHKQINLANTLKVLEYISDNNFDHIIISGDITENAESSAFALARNTLNRFGLLNPDRLTVTIGNHDIYGGVHLAEDVVNFPAKCRKTNFHGKVREFAYYFRETFGKAYSAGGNIFPFIKELDEIVIAGFNSIAYYSFVKNPFASNGKISVSQLEHAERYLNEKTPSGKKRIAVTHHHFNKDSHENDKSTSNIWQVIETQTMKLRNKKKIIRKLKNSGFEYVLHGHLHETCSYKRKNIQFINSGGSVLANNFGKPAFTEINVNSDGISHNIITVDSGEPVLNRTNNNKVFSSLYSANSKEICLN